MSGATLMRFYSLHFFLPFLILVVVMTHVLFLHLIHSTSPLHLKGEGLKFSAFFGVKDLLVCFFLLLLLFVVVFFLPSFFLEKEMFEVANPLMSPEHIVPE